MKFATYGSILLCILCGCHHQGQRTASEDDIREAAFRHLFQHNASFLQQQASAFFLQIGKDGGEPSDRFMERFANHSPPVKKSSRARIDIFVEDKETGKHGLLFRVTSIKWLSDVEVEVSGGYHEANMSASGNTYLLRKENGKWKVIGDKRQWISVLNFDLRFELSDKRNWSGDSLNCCG